MEVTSRTVTRNDVVACYRAFLERDPENDGVIESKIAKCATLEQLLKDFIYSAEFTGRRTPKLSFEDGVVSVFHTNNGDKIEVEVPDEVMNTILDRVIAQWTILGEEDPHWAVLSTDDFKQANMDTNQDKFYATGEGSFDVIEDFCRRNKVKRPKGVCMSCYPVPRTELRKSDRFRRFGANPWSRPRLLNVVGEREFRFATPASLE